MNLLQIQQECGRLLSDPNNDRWSPSTLTLRINIAQTEIEAYTKAIKTTETLTAAAGTIAVNSDTMDIQRVYLQRTDGSTRDIKGINIEELAYRYPDYSSWQAGEPQVFVYDATSLSITLYPPPDAPNQITNGLTVIEIRKPQDLVNPTDVPFDFYNQMLPFHYSILHWVVAHCFMDDGTPEALAKSRFHKSGSMLKPGEYEKEIGRIMAEFDSSDAVPGSILWRPQGGRVGTWYVPSKSNPMGWGGL